MGKSYLCAVFKALLEFLGRKPNTSAKYSRLGFLYCRQFT